MSQVELTQDGQRRAFTVDEAAKLWGISSRTVWRVISSRKLEVIRIGRSVRIPLEAIENFESQGGAA